ncbi:MAG: lipase family protein [Magnetococcales bacterium]|nr:lipase family protein [Magnetococcales bacterium]
MNGNRIELAARMALQAYNDSPALTGFVISPFKVGNIQGFGARKGDDLWIAFCGTNDAEDWLDNLDARKEPAMSGSVHTGFNQALDEIWTMVLDLIAQRGWRRLHLVGHSMGGALAALAGSRLPGVTAWMEMHIITFGQPRCGDRRWASDMEMLFPESYLRVSNAGDPVPHLPTCWRFRHSGREIYFDHHGVSVAPSLWHRMGSAFQSLVLDRRAPLATLHAHSMSRYLANVLNRQKIEHSTLQPQETGR